MVTAALRITAVLATHLRAQAQPVQAFLFKRLTMLFCSYRFSAIVSVNPEKSWGKTWGKSESLQGCSPNIRSFQSFTARLTCRKNLRTKIKESDCSFFFCFCCSFRISYNMFRAIKLTILYVFLAYLLYTYLFSLGNLIKKVSYRNKL